EVGYYVNPNANKLKNALIYCKTANTLDECQIMDGIDGAYFTTVTGSPYDIIKCDKNNGCKYHKLDQVTCGCIDDANNGTYCIGIDKIIYLNTNIDSTKTCTPLTATEEEADGKFYFTLSHTKMTTPSTTYYQCDVSGSDISNCEKKRAKLPECKTTNTTSS
ncbi:hypothetical protein PIROE2DRAFT_2279, partial [Piromyces sp. E2]